MHKTFIILVLFLISCELPVDQQQRPLPKTKSEFVYSVKIDTIRPYPDTSSTKITDSLSIEKGLISSGLVDIATMDSTIIVELKYSTHDNFLHTDVYGNFNKCYLQPDVADKLIAAQKYLKEKYPYYTLVIFDAVRPRSVQYKMWNAIDVPYYERSKYVSNPDNASLHNFGAAVDLSIRDENNIDLDMGTPYDFFGELAYPREEDRLFDEGKLTMKQLLNRKILRDIMIRAGFMPITTEWWHFNSCTRLDAFGKYKIVE